MLLSQMGCKTYKVGSIMDEWVRYTKRGKENKRRKEPALYLASTIFTGHLVIVVPDPSSDKGGTPCQPLVSKKLTKRGVPSQQANADCSLR